MPIFNPMKMSAATEGTCIRSFVFGIPPQHCVRPVVNNFEFRFIQALYEIKNLADGLKPFSSYPVGIQKLLYFGLARSTAWD